MKDIVELKVWKVGDIMKARGIGADNNLMGGKGEVKEIVEDIERRRRRRNER